MLGSGRLIPIVFFSLACSRFAPGSVIILATNTRSCSFATQISPILTAICVIGVISG